MIEINEKNHTSVIISSLDKIYNISKITGKLNSINLYLLNTIYKLLDGCGLDLTETQRKQLINLYRTIYFHSSDICNITGIEVYKNTYKTPFFQADSIDCNDYPIANKIYYWQEENYNTIIDDIILLVDDQNYFIDKNYDTKEIFESGKEINYNNIGRICFVITESLDTDEYKIYDSLNNDVTSTFNIEFIDSINSMLIVSQNFYSNGTMKFKIKKI